MATAITRYAASDGTVFQTASAADQHDSITARVEMAMLPLGVRPQALEDNKGYFQHSALNVRRVQFALFEIARPRVEDWIARQIDNGHTEEDCAIHLKNSYGRIADGCAPLDRAFTRLLCIDDQNREWQQPYFAINGSSDKAMVQLNKEATGAPKLG